MHFLRLLLLLPLFCFVACDLSSDGDDNESSSTESQTTESNATAEEAAVENPESEAPQEASSSAINVTGNWTGTLTAFGTSESVDVTLTQNGNTITGSSISDNYAGQINGNQITLFANVARGPNTFVLDASGTVNGDSMTLNGNFSGNVNGQDLSSPVTLRLTRVP